MTYQGYCRLTVIIIIIEDSNISVDTDASLPTTSGIGTGTQMDQRPFKPFYPKVSENCEPFTDGLRTALDAGGVTLIRMVLVLPKEASCSFIPSDSQVRQTLKGLQNPGVQIACDLEYADDIALVFEEKAQVFLDELTKLIPSFGIHCTPTKCKIILLDMQSLNTSLNPGKDQPAVHNRYPACEISLLQRNKAPGMDGLNSALFQEGVQVQPLYDKYAVLTADSDDDNDVYVVPEYTSVVFGTPNGNLRLMSSLKDQETVLINSLAIDQPDVGDYECRSNSMVPLVTGYTKHHTMFRHSHILTGVARVKQFDIASRMDLRDRDIRAEFGVRPCLYTGLGDPIHPTPWTSGQAATLSSNLNAVDYPHPVAEAIAKGIDEEQRMKSLAATEGLHAPLRLAMEKRIMKRIQPRLPGLHSHHPLAAQLDGTLDDIDVVDFLNPPEDAEVVGIPHLLMERRLGIL
ncbi:hypothetical protein CSKR_103835 [Clonorchis sinensis]|uniref:Proteasome maturation protein n=1 Tax=Clonorchis sinensis TaxID=79923 RepID=A0A3R7CCC1_CLOSI|nr:hypothetical protein CSKR_103835 [Clonorchis sinensis]